MNALWGRRSGFQARGRPDDNLNVRVREAFMTAGQRDLRPARDEKAIGPGWVAFLPLDSTWKRKLFYVQVRRFQGFFADSCNFHILPAWQLACRNAPILRRVSVTKRCRTRRRHNAVRRAFRRHEQQA
jgi:hypothetical protein